MGGKVYQLTEEQMNLLTSDLSFLINKLEKNFELYSNIEDLTSKVSSNEETFITLLNGVSQLLDKTQTKDEEVTKFIKSVSTANNEVLIEEIKTNYDVNRKYLDKHWKETKEQLLSRREDLILTANEALDKLKNIFNDDMLANTIHKNVQNEYFKSQKSIDDSLQQFRKDCLLSIESATSALLKTNEDFIKAKDKFNLAIYLTENSVKRKGFIKGFSFCIVFVAAILCPLLYFFTDTFNKPNQIVVDMSKIIKDKTIYDIGAESYYFFEKKGNFIILKNINN